jgi:hypothetical protein
VACSPRERFGLVFGWGLAAMAGVWPPGWPATLGSAFRRAAFGPPPRGHMGAAMVFISKTPGRRARVRFMPGCLIWSILLSVGLTILVNVLIRLF